MKPRHGTRSGRSCLALRAGAVGLLAVVATGLCCAPARGQDLDETVRQLTDQYAGRLAELAGWCDERGLAEEARNTRSWLRPRDPGKIYVTVLPRETDRPQLPADSPPERLEWHDRFTRLKQAQAGALYNLARRAIRTNRASLAFDLLMAALCEDPNHDTIRRLLGYQPYQGQWRTRYEINKLRRGFAWHERFGWLPRTHVRRYERGERYYRGRWISAEEDARVHRDINNGWELETEHYTVRTNHSIEAGVKLGRQLERLYRVWKQLFIRYYASEEQVAALFAGRARRPSPVWLQKRHAVVFFRDRDDYNRSLRPAFPGIEISVGVYADATRRAYFFAGEDYEERNLYHEATHQLFHESRPVAQDVGQNHNFWIIEGIALYMESLRDEDGFHVLGGFQDDRMRAAQYRLLHDNFYIPFAEFTSYGIEDFKRHERIATLYSQAAGLTHFLVHYDGGRYRDALVAYLTAVYSGRATPRTLAQLTETPYRELDRQYRQFIEQNLPPAGGSESL